MPPETHRMGLKVKPLKHPVHEEITYIEVATVNGPVEAVVSTESVKNDCIEVDVVGRVGNKYYVRLPASINSEPTNVWVDEEQIVNDGW